MRPVSRKYGIPGDSRLLVEAAATTCAGWLPSHYVAGAPGPHKVPGPLQTPNPWVPQPYRACHASSGTGVGNRSWKREK